MNLKAVAVVLALTGVGTSVAVAKGPPATDTLGERWVTVCHRTPSAARPFRPIRVARSALEAHMRHGDLLASGRSCSPTSAAAPDPAASAKREAPHPGASRFLRPSRV